MSNTDPLAKVVADLQKIVHELIQRVKSLEDTRDNVSMAYFQAPKKEPVPVAGPEPQKPKSQPSHPEIAIRQQFTEYQENHLNFTDKGTYWQIKAKEFLGTDLFAEIASVVRGLGGEYISAGKESHFRVPKK